MEELIAKRLLDFDWIVIDAPPVLAVTDAVRFPRADAVLLVARGANTPYEVAQRTKAAFGTSRILGFVLNAVKKLRAKDRTTITTTTTTMQIQRPVSWTGRKRVSGRLG